MSDNIITTEVRISPSPQMGNFVNKMHGGELLKLLDQVASITSRRYSRNYCVTAKILDVEFFSPIDIGSYVIVKGTVIKTGRTSMTVGIEVSMEDTYAGSSILTNTATFIMVSLGADGRSKPVPSLNEASLT